MNILNLDQVRSHLRDFAGTAPEPVHEWLTKHLVDFWIFRAQLLLADQPNLQLSNVYDPLRALVVAGVALSNHQEADLYREQLCRVGVRYVENGIELDLINQHYFQTGIKHEPGYKVVSAIDKLVEFLIAVHRIGGTDLLVQIDPYQFHQAVIGFRARG